MPVGRFTTDVELVDIGVNILESLSDENTLHYSCSKFRKTYTKLVAS